MAAHVADQAFPMGEGPGAQAAAKGALTHVDALVDNQVALLHKGLAAVARVYAPVDLQVARVRCLETAQLAVQ